MGSLYREKKNDLDEILLEVIHNSAETDKMFDAIFDENLKAIETQRDTETEDQLSPLLDQNLSESDANIPYIKLPEKKTRKRKCILRSLSDDQVERIPKVLKLMVDTIYDPIFEIKKENIVEQILKKYDKNNDTLLIGLENLRNDLDHILGKKKRGRLCKTTKPRLSNANN